MWSSGRGLLGDQLGQDVQLLGVRALEVDDPVKGGGGRGLDPVQTRPDPRFGRGEAVKLSQLYGYPGIRLPVDGRNVQHPAKLPAGPLPARRTPVSRSRATFQVLPTIPSGGSCDGSAGHESGRLWLRRLVARTGPHCAVSFSQSARLRRPVRRRIRRRGRCRVGVAPHLHDPFRAESRSRQRTAEFFDLHDIHHDRRRTGRGLDHEHCAVRGRHTDGDGSRFRTQDGRHDRDRLPRSTRSASRPPAPRGGSTSAFSSPPTCRPVPISSSSSEYVPVAAP